MKNKQEEWHPATKPLKKSINDVMTVADEIA
jgi:hypothetical protein